MTTSRTLTEVYDQLLEAFGPQHWWPGDSQFEIIIGAILTQNTSWKNVARAIDNLNQSNLLSPDRIHQIDVDSLAAHIRPAGYYNVKAKRLKSFMNWLFESYDGDLSGMAAQSLESLREDLLQIKGIGPETADSILLYALEKPTFVVDAYTYRVFSRHNVISEYDSYDEIKAVFEDSLELDVQMFNEYHALLVRVGKDYCKPKPRCDACPLLELLGEPDIVET